MKSGGDSLIDKEFLLKVAKKQRIKKQRTYRERLFLRRFTLSSLQKIE